MRLCFAGWSICRWAWMRASPTSPALFTLLPLNVWVYPVYIARTITTPWWYFRLACCLLRINFPLNFLFSPGFLVFFFSPSSLRSPLLHLSSEEAVSTFAFQFHLFLVCCVQFNLSPVILWFCVVWWHHRANIIAGGVPAVGSAADVVVLASVLHCGKCAHQTLVFEPENQTEKLKLNSVWMKQNWHVGNYRDV